MKRGTTPRVLLTVNGLELKGDEQRIIVTIKQKAVQLDYEDDDITVNTEKNTITVYMTQEQTLRLKQGSAQIQLRIRTKDGVAIASNIVSIDVGEILKEGII